MAIFTFILIGILFFLIYVIDMALKAIRYDLARIGNTLNELEGRILELEYPDDSNDVHNKVEK